MKTTHIYINKVYLTHRLMAVILMLFAFFGSAWAQGTDGQFVIRNLNGHYLAHEKVAGVWTLQDAIAFDTTCLWYSGRYYNLSGTNHNYYFIDENGTPRFLQAPMEPGGSLSLSSSLPETYLLGNTDGMYYFYNWDYSQTTYDGGGAARGHKWSDITSQDECENSTNNYSWGDNECWEVYWVSLDGSTWKLTDESSYTIYRPEESNPDLNAGRYRTVADTVYERVETPVSPGGGGLTAISVPDVMEWGGEAQSLSATISDYTYTFVPAYTKYTFEGVSHYYYDHSDHNAAPGESSPQTAEADDATYVWSITGDGATFLQLTNGTTATPTLAYVNQNTEGHKTATVTLTVTYGDGAKQTMQANVVVKTPCQSPAQADTPVCTYDNVTIFWYATATDYNVYWKKTSETDWPTDPQMDHLGPYATSCTIDNGFYGLEPDTDYDYKVCAICEDVEQTEVEVYHFKTKKTSGVLVYGGVFGGGRMADVSGTTEVVVINCDSINAVFGGNDIAGTVSGANGSTITLGVDASSDESSDAYIYNYDGETHAGAASTKVRVRDVYGGGNGYYIYYNNNDEPILPGVEVGTTQFTDGNFKYASDLNYNQVCASPGVIPKITKTAITVTNNAVKVDSIFGGAKNAFITNSDANANGTSITVDGGIAYAVFGGNNYGGTQTAGKQHIAVTGTVTETTNYNTKKQGRDFGIGYVFGGGNKVAGKITDILITGGQCDSVFAGGNAADVAEANVEVRCALGAASSGNQFGNVFSSAISSCTGTNPDFTLTIDEDNYDWNGTGIYNVRALFGGNNKATMHGLPTITLTSGSIGTVYGGGNAGDMMAKDSTYSSVIGADFGFPVVSGENKYIKYSTHVILNSSYMLIDYLYGGCQMSNVEYSTWVEMQGGHVGNLFGGCNISGDVGSRWVIPYSNTMPGDQYQLTKGATYVKVSNGTIYNNLYAGSNGYYHCNDGVYYIPGIINPDDDSYIGMPIPTHNETHVKLTGGTVKGNMYAGGNMAPVGFIEEMNPDYKYRNYVGFASVCMTDGTVNGNVYGGGNMASIYGSNEVKVSGGSIGKEKDGALYGGNDQCGLVAQITNRVLPDSYNLASDGKTSLSDVHTYISLTGAPDINTVYGGGNGAYDYTPANYCNPNDQPIQSNTFVDININGYPAGTGGHIDTVYGGGNGVTVTGGITVFLNVKGEDGGAPLAYDHVGTIFGGNNKGPLDDLVPNIILLNGQVNTVYGGCNEGKLGHHQNFTIGDVTYEDIGSMVRLRSEYDGDNNGTPEPVNAVVSGYVYGGCCKNGVDYNTLVLVEAGDHTGVQIFGGSDISGNVGGTSHVVVTGASTVVGDVYGGGNGSYGTIVNNVYTTGDYAGLSAPYCATSHVDLLNGTATNLYAGGYAGLSGETILQVDGGTATKVFGGGNEAGTTTAEIISGVTGKTGNSTVNITNGTVVQGIYGGCNTTGTIEGDATVTITGTTDNHTTIGATGAGNGANIHGGGYGAPTRVSGDVTVNFGVDNNTHCDYPILYGDMYGGSALGDVNTDENNTTTVNICNGTITGPVTSNPLPDNNIYGYVFGGGLGDADHAAKVNGVVHVNIGSASDWGDQSTFKGQANLIYCQVFGCNNANGSPQDDVFVDVFSTYRRATDAYDYTGLDATFAIDSVFGGGNKANYEPVNQADADHLFEGNKTHLHIHGCYNSIENLYAGGNAADAAGVVILVEGGRFDEVFGGGNGYIVPANIGYGGEGINVHGGHLNFQFDGSNMQGQNLAATGTGEHPNGTYLADFPTGYVLPDCGEPITDSYFVGTNESEIYGGLTQVIECDEGLATKFRYTFVYGGCRWGTVYGDINLTVEGGTIENLFGGSKGKDNKSADIRKFPAADYNWEDNPLDYSKGLKQYMIDNGGLDGPLAGTGGNINVLVKAGTIGRVIGGCDFNGNVEGKITVTVEEDPSCGCSLFLGDVYGGGNQTDYKPDDASLVSPEVKIVKGVLGGTATFVSGSHTFDGNVFGGGNRADVTANPKVIIGNVGNTNRVTINGSVHGGGNEGDVTGSPQVIIVPTE